jgi:hypothetical protein
MFKSANRAVGVREDIGKAIETLLIGLDSGRYFLPGIRASDHYLTHGIRSPSLECF